MWGRVGWGVGRAAVLTAVASSVLTLRPAPAAGLSDLPADVFARPAVAAPVKLPDDVFARPPGDDRVDVVLIGGGRAAVVRFNVTVGGRGYRSAWGEFVVRLHAYLDRDGDGVLTTAEANRAPWTNLLQSPFNGNRAPVQPGAKPTPVDADKNGKVTVEELSSYLRGMQNFDALGVQGGPPPDARTESVFKHLDHDADKAITPNELAATEDLLTRLDRDENEVLDLDELTPDRSPFADRFGVRNVGGQKVDPDASPIVVLSSDDDRERLAKRLTKAYGKAAGPNARWLTGPEPLGLSRAAFRSADRDGDGRLSAAEVARYLADPSPDLEVNATLPLAAAGPRPNPGALQITLVPRQGAAPKDLSAKTENGNLLVTFEGAEIELRAADSLNQFPDNFFDQQFQNADSDKNGVLSAQEVRGNFFLQRMFPVADRNGDGKLTRDELKAYNERNTDAVRSRVAVTVADRGSTLHQRLDADRDNRLSRRELRKAAESLAALDLDHDGRVSLAELPRRSLLVVGREDRNGNGIAVVTRTVMNTPPRASTGPRPAWFVGMDRNRDGDVSPREFLGPPEHFRLFDADGDGLISADEAAKSP